jgi:hypothetical protein
MNARPTQPDRDHAGLLTHKVDVPTIHLHGRTQTV